MSFAENIIPVEIQVYVVGWWCAGSTVVVRVSHHCDQGSISAAYSYLIKVTLVTCEMSVVQFVSTKHRRFSPGNLVSSCSRGGFRQGCIGRAPPYFGLVVM